MNIEQALEIALEAHRGQVDKAGKPYILHPLRVMHRVSTEDEQIVAILHDVFEDTFYTMKMVEHDYGISNVQKEALQLLTHKKGVKYEDYIINLSNNKIALAVKMQDLADNMDRHRYEEAINNGADVDRMKRKQSLYCWAHEYLRTKLIEEYERISNRN